MVCVCCVVVLYLKLSVESGLLSFHSPELTDGIMNSGRCE